MRAKLDEPTRQALAAGGSLLLLLPIAIGSAAGNPLPFTEEAVARGIVYSPHASGGFGFGLAFADLDHDGDPDLVVVGRIDGHVGLYENDGTGQFVDRAQATGLRHQDHASGISAADYDGDGDLDLLFTNWMAANNLLRNDGALVFTLVPALVGAPTNPAPGAGAAWGDYDDDGWLDLFVANRTDATTAPVENFLFRNRGDGTLLESSLSAGLVGDGATYQGVFFDYDRDGDADLYESNDKCGATGISNRLWRNDGGTFSDVTSASGSGACIDSMGVAVGDFDRNRAQDLYVTNISNGNTLFLNQGDSTFLDFTAASGAASFRYGWGTAFLDYDNDGRLELYVVNQGEPNRLYDHDGSWPVTDLAPALAITDGNTLSYGMAYADIDGDGDLDIATSNSLAPIRLFVNHEGQTRNWIRFDVRGRGHNRFGIGATVDLRSGAIWQTREVAAGGSYKSQHELTLHFGLDTATDADEIEVVWPGGSPTRILANLPANRTWTLFPPEALGDGDEDGDVDLGDFTELAACACGPIAGCLDPGCEMMDFDGDADVDLDDFDAFLTAYGGPLDDCNDNGHPDLEEIVLGSSLDLDRNGIPDGCDTPGIAAGRTGQGVSPLRAARLPTGVELSWAASCVQTDTDYAVYSGLLGDFASHLPTTCSTGSATTWAVALAGASAYYLVTPHNGNREGSLGTDSGGIERRQPPGACLAQHLTGCP